MRKLLHRGLSPFRFTAIRFGLVSLFSEALYFILYGLVLSLSNNNSSMALAVAGGICIVVNSYVHSRITFKVEFRWKLLLGYLMIQVVGFLISFLVGVALNRLDTGKWLIAIVTYTLWAGISFVLTRILYEKKSHRSAHHPPIQR
jgi:putative flippase GtrA